MNITTKAKPKILDVVAKPTFAQCECRRFYVGFGYQNRGSIQVRLDPDNESVYLSVEKEFGEFKSAVVSLQTLFDVVSATILASKASISDNVVKNS